MQSLVQAELRYLYSPDVSELENFRPDSSFGFLLTAMIGPKGAKGEESFDIMVCTPDWFADQMKEDVVSGRHYLFVKHYDYVALKKYVEKFCDTCLERTWADVALRLSRLGHWEFEDYRS